jgi:hypothetical protein
VHVLKDLQKQTYIHCYSCSTCSVFDKHLVVRKILVKNHIKKQTFHQTSFQISSTLLLYEFAGLSVFSNRNSSFVSAHLDQESDITITFQQMPLNRPNSNTLLQKDCRIESCWFVMIFDWLRGKAIRKPRQHKFPAHTKFPAHIRPF